MIHCVGDSHASIFSGNAEMQPQWPDRSDDKLPYFRSYRIGPATAYQLESKIPIIDQIVMNLVDIDKDSIMFCFGEVDIRAHLIKQMQINNLSIQSEVKECVDRYMTVLRYYSYLGYNIIAWGPIASWHPSKEYIAGPSFGTCFERNSVTAEFNKYLRECCEEESMQFVTIFDKMVDENKITKPEFLDDWDGCHIHLNQTAMPLILEVMKNILS